MRRIIMFFMSLLCIAASANSQEVETYSYKLGLFNAVKVLDNVNVAVKCNPDSTGYATFRTSKALASAPMFSLNKGCLKVQIATDYINRSDLPTICLYSESVNWVENSSTCSLTIENPGPSPFFKAILMGNGSIIVDNIKSTEVNAAVISGNGTITLTGEAGKCTYKMVGTGVIQADDLKCQQAVCKIMGTGAIGCYALDKIDVRGLGATKIYYKGNPKIKKVGGGKIIPLGNENMDYEKPMVEE